MRSGYTAVNDIFAMRAMCSVSDQGIDNVLRLGVVADFQHKSSIEELHLNLPQNCRMKHVTHHNAKPMSEAGILFSY
jgi:hypothetical protein